MVNDLKVRRHQPQGSDLAFKVRSNQNHCSSSRSQSGRCQATAGNLSCIFCWKNDMSSTNESDCRNGVEPSGHLPQTCYLSVEKLPDLACSHQKSLCVCEIL